MEITPKIVIGIYIDDSVNKHIVEDTLYHIELNLRCITHYEVDVILLSTTRKLVPEYLIDKTVLLNASQQNRPTAFNQLIKQHADYYLFLAAGCYIAGNCLDLLIKPFSQSILVGLTGPSSNAGNNEQNVLHDKSLPHNSNILQRSNELQSHSSEDNLILSGLLEHCFVVSKSVVDSIGDADIRYKDGYYWEADYHTRATLFGFQCLWVKAAYAQQYLTGSALGSTLLSVESRSSMNKLNSRLYQQKFDRFDKIITIDSTDHLNLVIKPTEQIAHLAHYLTEANSGESNMHNKESYPLISCIMPTTGRAKYLEQSLYYFSQQSYPNTELIIVYEFESDLPLNIADYKNVYTFLAPPASSIGHKRNIALAESCGEIIVHWDDDDWYGKDRLLQQALPLLNNEADISALHNTRFFVLKTQEAWSITTDLYEKMFLFGVPAGTIMYKTNMINSLRYNNISLREDALFLEALILNNQARLTKVDGYELFVYIRHDNNTWTFQSGEFVSADDWNKDNVTQLFGKDMDFYLPNRSTSCTSAIESSEKKSYLENIPKISCIMPTGNRKAFAMNAIRYFMEQSYNNKELIIIDDGEDDTASLISSKNTNIKYTKLTNKMSVGEKRNIAIEQATGEVIVHWDDDDWISSDWLSTQVNTLLTSAADLVGIKKAYYYNPYLKKAWQYTYPTHYEKWVLGGSMCYKKQLWKTNKFADMYVGEDSHFLSNIQDSAIIAHDNSHLYVGIIHEENVSPKYTDGVYWQEINIRVIKEAMQSDFYNYI